MSTFDEDDVGADTPDPKWVIYELAGANKSLGEAISELEKIKLDQYHEELLTLQQGVQSLIGKITQHP